MPGWIVGYVLHVAEVGVKLETKLAGGVLRAFGDENRRRVGRQRTCSGRTVGCNQGAVQKDANVFCLSRWFDAAQFTEAWCQCLHLSAHGRAESQGRTREQGRHNQAEAHWATIAKASLA